MRNKILLIFAAVLLAAPAAAQPRFQREGHLEPEGSILGGTDFLSGYETIVRDLLHDAYDRSVDVRMLALPSFHPEYAVGLRSYETIGTGELKTIRRGSPYHIFVLVPEAQIWTYQTIAMFKNGQEFAVGKDSKSANQQEIAKLQNSVPADPKDLKINRCEVNISDVLGDRIVKAWNTMLLATRYSVNNPIGLDGVGYYFSDFSSKAGPMAGQVWSPDRDSKIGTLVTLADTMRAVCEKKATMSDLDQLTTELEQRLQKGEGK